MDFFCWLKWLIECKCAYFRYHFLSSQLFLCVVIVLMLLIFRSFGMKTHINNDEIDVENGKLEKDREKAVRIKRVPAIQNQALLSGLAYCFSSCSMILVNKYVLSSYDFNAGISLMLYQVASYIRSSIYSPKYIFSRDSHWLYCCSANWSSLLCSLANKILFMLAELCLSSYCFCLEFPWHNYHWATDMEINQGLVARKFYFCGHASHKYV